MALPPPLTEDKANATPMVDDHPAHHNALADALNVESARSFDVRSFGAALDGVTDDTAAWLAALEAAANADGLASPHGVFKPPVVFSGHSLVQPGVLVADAGQSILGTDPINSMLLHPGGGGQESYLLKVSSQHGSYAPQRLANFSIRGLSDLRTEVGGGLWLYQSSLVRLENVRVRSIKGTATRIEGCWDCAFINLYNENCGTEADYSLPATLLCDSATDDCDNLQFYNLHTEGNQGVHLEMRRAGAARLSECRYFGLKVHGRQTLDQASVDALPNVPLVKIGANSQGHKIYGGLVAWGRGSQLEIAGRYNLIQGVAFGVNGGPPLTSTGRNAVDYAVHLTATAQRNLLGGISHDAAGIGTCCILADVGSRDNIVRDTYAQSYAAKPFVQDAGTNNTFAYRKADDNREYQGTGEQVFEGTLNLAGPVRFSTNPTFAASMGATPDVRMLRVGPAGLKVDDALGGGATFFVGGGGGTTDSAVRIFGYDAAATAITQADVMNDGLQALLIGGTGCKFFTVRLNGSANDLFKVESDGTLVMGNAALATGAVGGFLYVESMAGAPSGTPNARTGRVPLVVDTTNGRLYAYYGAAWHFVAFT